MQTNSELFFVDGFHKEALTKASDLKNWSSANIFSVYVIIQFPTCKQFPAMLLRDFPKSVMCGIAERIGKPFSHVQEPFRSQSVHVTWLGQDTCMDGCISNPLKWLRPRNLTLSCANMVSSIQCLGCLPTFLDELRTCTGTKLRIV